MSTWQKKQKVNWRWAGNGRSLGPQFCQEAWGFPSGSVGKESACNAGDRGDIVQGPSLGREDPLGKKMATHSSIPAWEIPWTQEPGGL